MATTSENLTKAAPGNPRRAAFAAAGRLRDVLAAGGLSLPVSFDPARLRVTELGVGESYSAWLADDGVGSLVIRLPMRDVADLPCGMRPEFAARSLIPEGVGSRPVAMDETSDNALGHPYLASLPAPGRQLAVDQWDAELLTRHAQQLAVLHDPVFDTAGVVGQPGEPLDLVAEFDAGFAWWRAHHGATSDTDANRSLAAGIRQRLVAARPHFDRLRYSLIHGDLVITNIVVDDARVPRYIDWEWARIGDVAKDLAMVGGTVVGGRWYVPMDEAAIDAFIDAYVAECARLRPGLVPDPGGLRVRRDAWELHERFQTSQHFAMRAAEPGAPAVYAEAAHSLWTGLARRLGG